MVEWNAPDKRNSDCAEVDANRPVESAGQQKVRKPRWERLQVCVAKHILDRCWDIASIDRVTVASLVEEALEREIQRREGERGEPYPRRRDGRLQRRRVQ